MKEDLRPLLHLTFNQVRAMLDCGQISQRLWRAWAYLWTWSEHRHSGPEGAIQDAYYLRCGHVAFYAKMNKCRVALGFPAYTS